MAIGLLIREYWCRSARRTYKNSTKTIDRIQETTNIAIKDLTYLGKDTYVKKKKESSRPPQVGGLQIRLVYVLCKIK